MAERETSSWELVENLFDQAFDLPAHERIDWVIRHAPDMAVRQEVLGLLAAADRRGILDGPSPVGPVTVPSTEEIRRRLDRSLQGRYRIGAVLGHGGMATVFQAEELKHDRTVVLKVLRPEVARWVGAERFLSEIRIVARLSHPLIVSLIDSGDADGLLYFVMPFLGTSTLRSKLAAGPIPFPEARVYLRDVAAALAHAHGAGLVHRDLKPDNVLVTDAHAFLMDFGVAKLRPEGGSLVETADGLTVGTPAYMAPEQTMGGPVDSRADIYGWGILARELLLGRLDRSARLPSDVPEPMVALIDACLASEPKDRPADGAALVARLAALRGRGSRRSARFLTIGLVFAATASAVGLWLARHKGPTLDTVIGPVAVAPLRNETGDSSYAVWGRLAGDWLTQGLQETGRIAVIPWPVALQSAAAAAQDGGEGGVEAFARETGAGTVVTGAYYLVNGIITFQAHLIDAASGRPLATLPPVTAVPDSVERAVRQLRDRLMGVLAIRTDRLLEGNPGLGDRPPTYEAYRVFERGINEYNNLEYRPAAASLIDAWRRDTVFIPALIYAARAFWNIGDRARADSLVREIRARPAAMSSYHALQVTYLEFKLAGDGIKALAAIQQAAKEAPGGRADYNVALSALAVGRTSLALETLRGIDPDLGPNRGWAPYWATLSHTLHLLGRTHEEVTAAREYRRRHPDNRSAWVHEVRAAATIGDTRAIDSLIQAAAALPPDTYWSQGAMMVTAGEELAAHGFESSSGRYLEMAVGWLANQLARDPSHRAHRYWMGSAQYSMGHYEDAGPYFESLARDYQDDLQFRGLAGLVAARRGDSAAARAALGPSPRYERAEHQAFLARYAAVAGDPERAIALWSEVLGGGISGLAWIHASGRRDLQPIAADPRFVTLGLIPPKPTP